jgi:hypothetical protein
MKEFLLNKSIWIALILWAMLAATFNLWQLNSHGGYSAASLFNMLVPVTLLGIRSWIVFTDLTKR